MTTELRSLLLNEATRIGDELLSLAEFDDNGISWKTMSIDSTKSDLPVSWRTSESLYSGVSGIALFLLELYKQTQNEKYRQAVEDSLRWVEHYCHNTPTDYFALFTGRMGASYTMLRMFDATKDSHFLERALTIAQPCLTFLNSRSAVDDLINGTSGTLLGLLHLHAATGEAWIAEAITSFTEHLVNSAHHGPVGLYWDRSAKAIRGLCGFSHGASGIGFVFLELGHYFGNESFYWMAEQAFLYESHFFDEARNNWPDFRKGIYKPEDYEKHESAYLSGDMAFFTQPGDMCAWCHGAAGIGLSRLRAHELLEDPLYENDARRAIEKTRATTVAFEGQQASFTLCHGGGGNAELFLEAYRTFTDEECLSLAETVAERAANSKKEKGVYLSGYSTSAGMQEDTSLFMGIAGIGYFYLSVLEPLKVRSILAPSVELPHRHSIARDHAQLTVSKARLQKQTLERVFPRTCRLMETISPGSIESCLGQKQGENRASVKETFVNCMEDLTASLPLKERERVSDVFNLELEKARMDEAIASNAFLYIKEQVLAKEARKLAELADESFLALRLVFDPDSRIILTAWNWSLASQESWTINLTSEAATYPVLLKPSAERIIEIELSPFTYLVLTSFQSAGRMKDVIQEISDSFESVPAEQEETIRKTVLQQIKEALLSSILVESKL